MLEGAACCCHGLKAPDQLRLRRRSISGGDMVYVDTWDEFAEKAELLFRSDPVKFRYVTRYRHTDGKLILKATDNRICIKYKTDQANDLKKLEKLNNLFFTLMSRGLDASVADSGPAESATAPAQSKRGRGRRQ